MDIQQEIAQAIANSFFDMEAGELPTGPWETPTPSSGDMQLAHDLMPLFRHAQAEGWGGGYVRGWVEGKSTELSEHEHRHPHNPYTEQEVEHD